MLTPHPDSPRIAVAYGTARRSTVEFALDTEGHMIGRYVTAWPSTTWERRYADPTDEVQSEVIEAVDTLLREYGRVTTA